HGAARRPPSGPVRRFDDLLQLGARRVARRGGRRGRPNDGRDRRADQRARQLPGHGTRLPGVARQPTVAHPRSARHRLHRARRSLRELRAPDHDPLDLALGGRGRAARADGVSHRVQHHRADRRDPPDRHREKERHHDDRLRDRSREERAQESRSGDSAGVPAAFPPDHDDHDSRDAGRGSARDRLRRRLGVPPAARHRHRRRPCRQPTAHTVYNPRRVPLSRPLPPVVQAHLGWRRGAALTGGAVRRSAAGILALALAACAVGPDYRRPEAAVSAAYKEAVGWKVAEPRDEASRGNWWEIFGDPQLSALMESIDVSNQNVRLAEARFRQAQALAAQSRAALFPTLDANASITRNRSPTGVVGGTTAGRIIDNRSVALNSLWEIDLWGRLRRALESSAASAQASAADLAAARLAAQAELASSYFQFGVLDAQKQLLDGTVTAFDKSLELTRNRY